MAEPKVSEIKKYISAMEKMKKKYITVERLSRVVGYYPDVIQATLEYFEPMLKMQPDFNLLELVPAMKKYVIDKEENKVKEVKAPSIKKNQLEQYDSAIELYEKEVISLEVIFLKKIIILIKF